MNGRIVLLPGDGIGPEIICEAVRVLISVSIAYDHTFQFTEKKLGGASIDAYGTPLTDETLEVCNHADGVLLGAVGGPRWDGQPPENRPEKGLLALRKGMEVYCNLRPLTIYPCLAAASPLKPERVEGTDILMVRELTGDIYFGEHRLTEDKQAAFDAMSYSRAEIERTVRIAFQMAMHRKKRLCSVDKANVLACSRLWRETVEAVHREYPEVALTHMYVDNCAMQLASHPAQFDVIVTGNLFGDILSDEAAAVAGSLGVMPSASLGDKACGLFEPIHGSAPDIAGQDLADPIGAILSAALLLRYSLGLLKEADTVEQAVAQVLADGWRTADLGSAGMPKLGTQGMGQLIAARVEELAEKEKAQ